MSEHPAERVDETFRGLLFSVEDLRSELTSLRGMARDFLVPGGDSVLRGAEDQLLGIARSDSDGKPKRWCIEAVNPLKTQASAGEYMPDQKGGETIHAVITFVWEIRPIRPTGDSRQAKSVRLEGIASTQLQLFEGGPFEPGDRHELACWRMEIADMNAPGAFFHVQVLGRDDDVLFPKSVDIPRLPGVLNSPFACIEFALGELFQQRWVEQAQKETSDSRRWGSIQSHRNTRHLQWAMNVVRDSSGSPWATWKISRPDEDLFLPA